MSSVSPFAPSRILPVAVLLGTVAGGSLLPSQHPAQAPSSEPGPAEARRTEATRRWHLAIFRSRTDNAIQPKLRHLALAGHRAYLDELTRTGEARLTGPIERSSGDGADSIEVVLLATESKAHADRLCFKDPAVAAQQLRVEILPWRGPIGIDYPGNPAKLPRTVSLWNGKDLTGWHADIPNPKQIADRPASFVAKDGLLISRGSPQGHLITDRSFRNYRLVVEYRWPGKPGNCGVLVHASEPRMLYKMFPRSVECQMHHGNAGDFWCIGQDVKVPDMVTRRGPKAKWGVVEGKNRRVRNLTDGSERPLGEWNRMVIECRGHEIEVWVNGDRVNHAYECTTDHGQIAIQAEGARCEFRRLDWTPLGGR